MKRKYISKSVDYQKELQIVLMYGKDHFIKDISAAVNLNRGTVTKVLDAHGIRKPYRPAEAKKGIDRGEGSGTIIQQCVAGMSEQHKKITSLFKPTMTA